MTVTQGMQETTDCIKPITFLDIGNRSQVPAPLIRVTTCGLLTIEIVAEVVSSDPPRARYLSLTPEQLRGRGTAPALTLLKLLLSCPHHFALKEWLTEAFCHERELFSSARIENIVSLLRGLLCPPAYEELRTHLIAHTRSSPGSGDGYQLAAHPLIWNDLDALTWHAEQAARMERFGDDPLPFWERVHALARRGIYLPDEIYSDWAEGTRAEVAGLLRQSIQALARLYLTRHGRAGEEEALLLLRSYWQQHPHEQDVLRQLMELLGQRERYHEALTCYERLEKLLEQDEQTPDAQTRDVAAYLRTKQLQRPPATETPIPLPRPTQSVTPTTVALVPPPVAPTLSMDDLTSLQLHRILSSSPMTFAHLLSTELSPEDTAIWFGIRSAHIMCLIQQWKEQALSCDILQGVIDREIAMFEKTRDTSTADLFTLSRRQALISLAALPTMLAAIAQGQPFSLVPEEFLPQCAASLTACWHLLRGQEFLLVEKVLTRYLPTLADFSHQPSIYQSVAAGLTTQGYRIMGIVAHHHNIPSARTAYYKQGLHFAEIASAPNMLASALISLAYEEKHLEKATLLYQQGLLLQQELSPLFLAYLYARLAVVSGQQEKEQDALRYLALAKEHYPAHPETDPGFLYAEFSPANLIMEEGLTYLSLTQQGNKGYAEQAWKTFAQVEQWQSSALVPARIQVEIVNHQARTALAMNDLERFCSYLEQGIHGAKFLHSDQRMQEALQNYKLARSQWPSEGRIQSLTEAFLQA